MKGNQCYESPPVGMNGDSLVEDAVLPIVPQTGLEAAHTAQQAALAVMHAAGRLKASAVERMMKVVGMMLDDMDTDPEIWLDVKSKLNRISRQGGVGLDREGLMWD